MSRTASSIGPLLIGDMQGGRLMGFVRRLTSVAYLHAPAAALRTDTLHVYGFDSIGIIF